MIACILLYTIIVTIIACIQFPPNTSEPPPQLAASCRAPTSQRSWTRSLSWFCWPPPFQLLASALRWPDPMTERGFFLWFAHSKKHHVYMFKDAVGFPSSKKKKWHTHKAHDAQWFVTKTPAHFGGIQQRAVAVLISWIMTSGKIAISNQPEQEVSLYCNYIHV